MESSGSSPATSLRLLRLGDNWVYEVAGTLTPPGGEPLALTGQIAVSIVPDRLLGRSDAMNILFAEKFLVTQPDGSKQGMPAPEWMFSFVQDATSRDVAITADNMTPGGTARIARVPQVFYPGSWSSQTAYSNRLDFDNGDYVDNTLAVFGQEQIETELGPFLSWKSRISSQSAAMGLIEGMDWWTPELGAPAKFSTISRMPDGSQMRFVATLRSTGLR
jgi:hypothetical protein